MKGSFKELLNVLLRTYCEHYDYILELEATIPGSGLEQRMY